MKRYAIMQEPGPTARSHARGYFTPRPKRVGTIEAETVRAALQDFVWEKYLARGNAQYRGHRLQKLFRKRWVDLRYDEVAKDCRVAVSLSNGAYAHEVYFMAWETDGRWERGK